MSKIKLLTVIIFLIVGFSFVYSQNTQAQSPIDSVAHQKEIGRGQMKNIELSEELNLNADQRTRINDILQQRRSQLMAIKTDTSLSKQDARAKIRDIRRSSSRRIDALLMPEQKAKLDNLRAETQKKQKEMRRERKASETTETE